jgi:hypothetical protein
MLTFFATLLVNILVGTVFYLIISLKLEKSASELHVKKIRREMEEMLREFNLTAERNISLLENRIEIMKRLLEKNGIPVGFEISADDTHDSGMAELPTDRGISEEAGQSARETVGKGLLGKLGSQLRHAIGDARTIREDAVPSKKMTGRKTGGRPTARSEGTHQAAGQIVDEQSPIVRSEENIRKRFAAAIERSKRYELIHELYEDGYPVETISRLSGVPSGEITLIVSLGSGR